MNININQNSGNAKEINVPVSVIKKIYDLDSINLLTPNTHDLSFTGNIKLMK